MPRERQILDDTTALLVTGDAFANVVDGDAILERRITLGRGPIGDVAVNSGAVASVVATNVADQSVSIFDPASRGVGDSAADDTADNSAVVVTVTGDPVAVVVTDDRAYVATASDNQDAVSVIDLETNAVVATFPLVCGVTALAATPDGRRVFAGRAVHDRVEVTVIDAVTESAADIEIGHGPAASLDALCVDASGERLYVAVTDVSGSRLVIVDGKTSRVRRVVPVGSPIRDIAHAGDTVNVLTSDREVGGAVHVIDLGTNRVTERVVIGGAPTQLVMSPDHGSAYIVDYDRVVVLCMLGMEIVDSLWFATRPSCVALGSDGAHAYVADYSGAVHKFSVGSTIETLYSHFLDADPIALAAPRTRELHAAAV